MKRGVRLLIPLLFWLLVWQAAAMAVDRGGLAEGWALWRSGGGGGALLDSLLRGKELLLPGPWAVLARLGELAGTLPFWQTAGASLLRVFAGFLAGAAAGAALAGLTSACRRAELLLSPAVRLVRATPVASFILLILLWVERGRVPGVVSALMVLPVVWENVARGAGRTDPQLLELAGAYGFDPLKTLRLIYVPSVLPYFASGCRTALGLAWKAGAAAEVLCLPRLAIGTQVYNAKLYLETASLFAWTLVVIALSFLLEWAMDRGLARLEGERSAP